MLSERLHLVLRRPKTVGRDHLKDSFTRELGTKLAQLPVADMAANKNFFVIVFTSGGDYRAFALPTSRLDDTADAVEFCVCPEGETAITVAHEILHLFGARDLYIEGESDDDGREMLDEMVRRAKDWSDPKVFDASTEELSIMAQPRGNPALLEVAPATAYSVGWLDKLPEPVVRSH